MESDNKRSEEILCAAIQYESLNDGFIAGRNHAECIREFHNITGKRQSEVGEYTQGFLTSTGRFIDRVEAATIHISNGGTCGYFDGTSLDSSDLWYMKPESQDSETAALRSQLEEAKKEIEVYKKATSILVLQGIQELSNKVTELRKALQETIQTTNNADADGWKEPYKVDLLNQACNNEKLLNP